MTTVNHGGRWEAAHGVGFGRSGGSERLLVHCADHHLSRGAEGCHGVSFGDKLHWGVASVLQFRELAIDAGVVDLAGSGLVAARNVRDVHETNEINVLFEFPDQISL